MMIRQILLFLFFLSIIHCSHKSKIALKEKYKHGELKPDGVIINFIAESYKDNNISWRVKSNKANIFSDDDTVFLFSVNMDSYKYKNRKRKTTNLISEKGLLDNKKNTFYAENNVIVTSNGGRKLYTDDLLWTEETETFQTESPVKITFPDGTIMYGIGMIADFDLNDIRLTHTTGIYNDDDEEEDGDK